MRIKRIEIIGFKSFCDRAVLNFSEPIVGVVGPNGCGKSNIVDAIRWCMGEQSAKHLRGQAMGDVIFAGSESRGPAGMAEVSLTFEDVGFSRETLELAQGDDDILSDPALAGDDGEAAAEDGVDAAALEAAVDGVAGDGAAVDGEGEGDAAGAGAAQATGEGAEGDAVHAAGDAVAAEVTEAGDGKTAQAADAVAEGEAAGAVAEGEAREAAGAVAGQAAGAVAGEGAPDPNAATREVQEMLADAPPAIDFARYSEVTITRRLFRDGTSLYLLNKTPCRLRDITDFFLGTGIGTKAYSIIEQGRIGMIVSSRANDRRHIIEEAAGITKFKTKKRAAERKLDQTKQNLLRISDIVSELEKRLGTLRRQAQKAERYRRYKGEVRDIEMWMASHRYLEYLAQDKTFSVGLAELRAALATTRETLDERDVQVVGDRAELAAEERKISALQEQIYELENRIRLSESKVDYQRREAGELEARASSARTEIEGLRERRSEAASDLESQSAELAELDEVVRAEEAARAEREAAFAEGRRTLSEMQARLEEARALLSAARSDLSRAENNQQSLGRRREDARGRLDRVLEETDESNRRSAERDREARGLRGKLSELVQTRLDLGNKAEEFTARKSELEGRASESEAEVETLRTELHRRRSRLQSLKEIHDKYEGFARGTRAVMQHSSELTAARPEFEIRGLVADVVEAPAELEVAVEAALGDRLGGILVNAPEVGVRAIEYLKETSSGRSAFVPFRAPAQAGPGIEFEDRSAAGGSGWSGDRAGVLGSMVDLVRFDDSFREVGTSLLGGHIVVESLARAIEMRDQGCRSTLVTLDGDIVDERGVVSGGSRDAQGASVLSQKREIRELDEIVGELEGDLANATARFVSTKAELNQVTKALESLRNDRHDGDLAITAHEKDLAGAQSELERLRERATRLNAEQLELEERVRGLDDEEREMVELRADALDRIDRHEREQLGLIAGVADGQAAVEEMSQALTEAKVRGAKLGEKRASLEASALRSENAHRELGDRIDRLEASISEDSERSVRLREESGEIEGELGGLRQQRDELTGELSSARAVHEERGARLAEAEVALRELRAEAERLSSSVQSLDVKQSSLRSDLRHLEASIEERYHVNLAKEIGEYHLRAPVAPEDEDRLAQRKSLIERMGSDINLTAIEEFAQINERHEFLSAQKIDLERALGQLERAIDKINKTSRKLFKDTFEAINARFMDMFPKLFRGGRARLALTGGDSVDLLEAGVEIMAQPPGKKNTTVDQLSGGEKALTAVALLFAIFLIKPSPFCLLDEVDAPLDEANVDRYNEILRDMTHHSQFIVITHNKRTMSVADRLYGVTMQEPGVSKLVSVNLNRVGEEVAAA